MTKVQGFICKNCGNKFECPVLEPGEAKAQRISTKPVCCTVCGSRNVERR